MKLVVLYRQGTEYTRTIETFVHDFQDRHGSVVRKIEMLDSDSRDGQAMMSLYDIMQQPALLALQEDGRLVAHWVGKDMPLMDDVASYFYSAQG